MATFEKLSSNKVKLSFVVAPEKFDEALQTAYHKMVKKNSIPGFRKGHAPMKVIENYNGASVFYLPVYIYFPVPWATYRPEIWAAYEAKDRDSLKVEYEKVMYDYMDDWLTNGNNSENRGTSWGQYKSRLEKGMGIDIGLTARETGFYETNYFYGGATATEQRASSTLSDTATSFIIEYIMGQKTEADWESFKQSWNDMGGADWTKEVNEQYKSITG